AAALQQHVPVGARRLGLLLLRLLAVDHQRTLPAETTLPGRGDLRFRGEGDGEAMAPRTVVGDLLARSQVGVAVVLVTGRPESGSAKCSLGHRVGASRRSCGLVGINAAVGLKIPRTVRAQPYADAPFHTGPLTGPADPRIVDHPTRRTESESSQFGTAWQKLCA